MIGYSGEILVKPFTDFIHPDDRNLVVDYHIRRLKGEEVPLAYSFRILSEDGTVKRVEFNTVVIQWKERPATLSFLNDITERKQMEETLRQSEERYRTIIETMQDSYWETDLAGSFTFVNEAQCRLSGTPREQLIGKNNRAYTSEKEAKRLYQLFSGIYRIGEPVSGFAFEFTKRDGTKAFHEVSASLIRDAGGKPIGFRGISRDITERKQAEEELRQSEEKYRSIIENMQEAYFEDDLTGNYTYVNEALCRSLGYTREELIGMNYKQYTEEKNIGKLTDLYRHLLKTGKPFSSLDMEAIRKDGTIVSYETSVSLIRDTKGKPIGFRGISRDVTERKQAEEKLQESEEKYRTIIENINDGYFEIDLAGIFTFVNEAECRNLGYTRKELLSMGPGKYIDEKKIKELTNLFIEIYKTGIPVKAYNLELTKKDGTKSFNEISLSLKRNSQSRPIGFRGISRDVTERKLAEEWIPGV